MRYGRPPTQLQTSGTNTQILQADSHARSHADEGLCTHDRTHVYVRKKVLSVLSLLSSASVGQLEEYVHKGILQRSNSCFLTNKIRDFAYILKQIIIRIPVC